MVLLVLSRDPMSPYRKPMPSFTLVLTSGPQSYRPSTIQFPPAPDYLMKTIHLHHDSADDEFVEDHGEGVDSQTIFEAEQPATIDHVAEQASTKAVKNLFFLIHKFISYKRKFVTRKNGPIVSLESSPN